MKNILQWSTVLLLLCLLGCNESNLEEPEGCDLRPAPTNPMEDSIAALHIDPKVKPTLPVGERALLASRFESLEAFQSEVQVDYLSSSGNVVPPGNAATQVRLTHCSRGQKVVGILAAGISQDSIGKLREGGLWDKVQLVMDAPYAISNRKDMQRVLTFARRKPLLFGEGDLAFFDLALRFVDNINTPEIAFLTERDTSEKGYLNTFNHITAQAFIATIFSEELADYVADLHERKNMAELITGKFTPQQLTDPDNNPVDNYVDIINNEWGQELGKRLKDKYHITRSTHWTPELLADYLNDVQQYYSWAFKIGFEPLQPSDEIVWRFCLKINVVMNGNFEVYS